MKENEAKQKRCGGPNGCGTLINPVAGGRKVPGEMLLQLAVEVNSPRWCIASGCMGWVQTDNECDPQQHPKDSSAVVPEPKCYPAGRCGLVGKQ